MASSEITLGEMFQTAGYRTALFGKWHLGTPLEFSPNRQGFDEFFGFKEGAMDSYSHFYYWSGMNRHVLFHNEAPHHEEGAYFPDMVVRQSTRFITENRDRPFFLCLPFNLPHYPLQPPVGSVERFAHIADPLRRQYAACVWALYECVGRVVSCLEENGLRQETIIVFSSDHGPSTEERGGGGSAGTLRGHKGTLWEGGIRVPGIFSCPGTIPAGQVRAQPAMSTDLLPTLATWCGVPPPARQLHGHDLAPVIASAAAAPSRPILQWTYRGDWALREGPWKFTVEKDSGFLARLDEDPGESRNRAAEETARVERYVDTHNRWIRGLTAARKAGL